VDVMSQHSTRKIIFTRGYFWHFWGFNPY